MSQAEQTNCCVACANGHAGRTHLLFKLATGGGTCSSVEKPEPVIESRQQEL